MNRKDHNNCIMILLIIFFVSLCFNSNTIVIAQATDVSKVIDELAVPESPAFAILGVTPESITRPASPRELALSFLQGLDPAGNFQSGLAIDTAPYLLFFGKGLTLEDYKKNIMKRELSRIQFSLATAKGIKEEDKAMRLSFGFRWVLWDEGDVRLDKTLIECIDEAHKEALEKFPSGKTLDPSEEEERMNRVAKYVEDQAIICRRECQKRNWNKSALDIGIAPSWISNDGTTNNVAWNGIGIWTSFSYGFNNFKSLKNKAQITFHTLYRTNESLADPSQTGMFFEQDSFSFGARLRYGNPKSSLLIQSIFIHAEPSSRAEDNSYRFSAGAEFQIATKLWLHLSVGGSGGRIDNNNQGFIISQLKWSFSENKAI
ncbi:MAG: hypothetical protein A2Y62_03960 [Candidatus Fischerbacteria bacterium RBG_13_37_8]|uniref:Uncharacterized protein n=1 Tax=Candidatus Fischerbacteria bacterium RBG_13_37_8 TaxID=1817863 RepID=A0A1F5V5V9_9BACT|nr:MAG: hypothetical protein A2Y62_03960 [Candidatus Fischerbacteria bacterium RBG_13_37_8]